MRFQTNTKTQENQATTQEYFVKQVVSISAALNENLVALYRVHPPLPMYFNFLHFLMMIVNNLSFLDTHGSLSFNNYIILPVLNTFHHISKFGYFSLTQKIQVVIFFGINFLPGMLEMHKNIF